jgi:DAK2 domain fusion protein YloV
VVRGFVDVLGQHEAVSTSLLSKAFRGASDTAYRAVKRPVEGTMLTVIREMAEESERKNHRELRPNELLQAVLARGEDALARTPDMLEVLRAAGVVDAGGAGLVEIARGMVYGALGEEIPIAPVEAEVLGLDAIHQELSRFRYCTVFVVEGESLDKDGLESELERIGDSLLVVGDESALKVHVHTDEPGKALALGTAAGVVEGVEIANMHHQTAQREERLLEGAPTTVATLETGLVAVCPGRGNRRLFESLGATRVIEGGQTMNPSAAEIVAAIDAVPTDDVLVLPNNSNVVLTAEQAAALSEKSVRVIPSRSVQAGFAAVSRFVATASADENEQAMLEELESAATGEVTGKGHMVFDGGPNDEHLEADHATYNVNTDSGKFYEVNGTTGARFRGKHVVLTSSNPFFFTGQEVDKIGPSHYVVQHGRVTTCELPHPKWTFQAQRVVVDVGGEAKLYHSTFRFFGIPIFYFPYAQNPVARLELTRLEPKLAAKYKVGQEIDIDVVT